MSLVPSLTQIVSGDADDPTRDMSNWNAIRNVVNGSLDTTNLSATAAITAAQTNFFTNWATWTPGYTGFSANPTVVSTRWMQVNKLAIVTYYGNAGGTSNGTGFTITGLPVAPAQNTSARLIGPADNGGNFNTGNLIVTSGSTTATLYVNDTQSATGWTASGTKAAGSFTLVYEVT